MPDVANLEGRATELLSRLIQFNTVNPPGDEQAAQEWLKSLLEGAGFECELIVDVPGRPNLIARLRGASDGPVLGYLGHVDTVLADPGDWSVDPWSGEVKDGCVWGRGALDMKGQVAAEIAAALELCASGWRPDAGDLLVIVTADEETGAAHGAQFLTEQHPDKVRCDLIVNEVGGESFMWDSHRVYEVNVAEKGVFRFTITTSGRAGHAAIPRIGDNALVKLAPILAALSDGRPVFERSPESDALLAALGIETNGDVAAALRAIEEHDPRLGPLFEPMLGVTMTPTIVEASHKINVIPAHASLQVDCRVPPGLGADHARARVEQVLGTDGYELTFNEGSVIGNRSPIETELMDHIRAFVSREDPGAIVAPTVLWGFTDSRWFREAFPECVAYGFCPRREMDKFEAAPLIHGADERVPVSDLGMAARFFAELAPKVLGDRA